LKCSWINHFLVEKASWINMGWRMLFGWFNCGSMYGWFNYKSTAVDSAGLSTGLIGSTVVDCAVESIAKQLQLNQLGYQLVWLIHLIQVW